MDSEGWPGTVRETLLQMEISLTNVNAFLQTLISVEFLELLLGLIVLKIHPPEIISQRRILG